jgi:protocatechuate 3,4-dioxygenase beta subunit
MRGVLLPFLTIVSLASANPPQKPGAVEGVVTNSVSSAPIKKAVVTLRSLSSNSGYQALSDTAGRFRFDNVTPGDYGLWAGAQGYVRNSGRLLAPSQAVSVAEEKTIKDFAIRLEPLGTISGKVLDENGDPVPGAAADGLQYSYSREGAQLAHRAMSTTNDRGEYRLFDLEPGRWYLRVTKSMVQPNAKGRVHSVLAEMDFRVTFYPGAVREAEAGSIEVAAGAELRQIDVRLRKVRVYHIRGKVIDAGGQAAAKARVEIEGVGYAETRPDGTFDVLGVPPGAYPVAGEIQGDHKLVSAMQQVTIEDRDVNGVVLRLEPAATVRGTAQVEEDPVRKLIPAGVVLEPLGRMWWEGASGNIQSDGTFAIPNVAPQTYRVMVERRPSRLYLKSMRLSDQDVSAEGRIDVTPGGGLLALVFGNDPGTVEGTVQSAGPGPAPVIVTLAPDGRLAGRYDLVQTVDTKEPGGSFRLENVAPGDYKVFAWELADEFMAESPEFRNLFESKAAAITVHAGEHQMARLTTITAAEIEEAGKKLR